MQDYNTKFRKILKITTKILSRYINYIITFCTFVLNIVIMLVYCKLCLIQDGNENNVTAIAQILVDAMFPATISLLLSSFIQNVQLIFKKTPAFYALFYYLAVIVLYSYFCLTYRKIMTLPQAIFFIIISAVLLVIGFGASTLPIIPPNKPPIVSKSEPTIHLFTDYSQSIQWALENDIIQKNVSFVYLEHNCKLEEALTFLWKAIEYPTPINSKPYKKLTKEDLYDKSIAWAKKKNIYCIAKSKKGQASMPCTFTVIIQILWTLKEHPSIDINDEINIPSENSKAISWALENDIIEQSFLDNYSLNQPCTIGQVLHRFFAKMPE